MCTYKIPVWIVCYAHGFRMQSYSLCDSMQVVQAVKSGKYPFVMCNFAPPDMVGHTGVYDAAVIACAATGEQYCPL